MYLILRLCNIRRTKTLGRETEKRLRQTRQSEAKRYPGGNGKNNERRIYNFFFKSHKERKAQSKIEKK